MFTFNFHQNKQKEPHFLCWVNEVLLFSRFQLAFNHLFSHILHEKSYQVYVNHINIHRKKKEYTIQKHQSGDCIQTVTEEGIFVADEELHILETNANPEPMTGVTEESNLTDNDQPSNVYETTDRISQLHSSLEQMEAMFALKLVAKYLLTQEAIDDIFAFVENVHKSKVEIITDTLSDTFDEENHVEMKKVIETIGLIDENSGLKEHLRSHYRREKLLKSRYDFIEPLKTPIGTWDNEPRYYYRFPVSETLRRMLDDESLREKIIHEPLFSSQLV